MSVPLAHAPATSCVYFCLPRLYSPHLPTAVQFSDCLQHFPKSSIFLSLFVPYPHLAPLTVRFLFLFTVSPDASLVNPIAHVTSIDLPDFRSRVRITPQQRFASVSVCRCLVARPRFPQLPFVTTRHALRLATRFLLFLTIVPTVRTRLTRGVLFSRHAVRRFVFVMPHTSPAGSVHADQSLQLPTQSMGHGGALHGSQRVNVSHFSVFSVDALYS